MTKVQAIEETAAAVTFDDVRAAANRIALYVHRTPVMTSRLANEACGRQLFFKCENLQRGGAFKIRGAANFLLSLTAEERARGVVAFSSGNHAQAVAAMAKRLGMAATIVMPNDSPRSKLEGTRSHGPKIVLYDREREDREALARELVAQTGATLVPPYDHEAIVAGQGTAAMELLEETGPLDALVIPAGGGGLLSGSVLSANALEPGTAIYGVEPETANDWEQSMRSGQRETLLENQTIADGLRTPAPGRIPWALTSGRVGILTVSDEELCAAVRFLLSRMKLVVEPSGAAGFAAVLHDRLPRSATRIGIILSGGNVDFDVLASICAGAPQA